MKRNLFFALAALAVGYAVRAEGNDVSFEVEPNDAVPQALAMGGGAEPGDPVVFRIKGTIDAGDIDRFSMQLNAGDVVGAVATDTSGVDPSLRLENAAGDLVMANDDKFFGLQHWASPLPKPDDGERKGDAILRVVIAVAGNYVLEVSGEDGTTGRYRLDLMVARPGLESHPVGTRQIVFVDFSGPKVNVEEFGGLGTKKLSPMRDFLVHWGLTAADEDAVIDYTLAGLKRMLSTEIRADGNNGDYAASGVAGEFDIEIRNSRDHADTYGTDPLVTRLVIGGTQEEAGLGVFAVSSIVDVGNFSTDDEAMVMLDQLAGLTLGPPVSRDLNQYGLAPGVSKTELVGRALALLGAHELGHVFGCWHTESAGPVANPMDRSAATPIGFDPAGTGPDRILGTADDVDKHFRRDEYDPREVFRGVQDTLNAISFGLSTGTK